MPEAIQLQLHCSIPYFRDMQSSNLVLREYCCAGAMSWALITTLEQQPDQTYAQILQNTRHMLMGKYTQVPQLAVGQKCNLDVPMRL